MTDILAFMADAGLSVKISSYDELLRVCDICEEPSGSKFRLDMYYLPAHIRFDVGGSFFSSSELYWCCEKELRAISIEEFEELAGIKCL